MGTHAGCRLWSLRNCTQLKSLSLPLRTESDLRVLRGLSNLTALRLRPVSAGERLSSQMAEHLLASSPRLAKLIVEGYLSPPFLFCVRFF